MPASSERFHINRFGRNKAILLGVVAVGAAVCFIRPDLVGLDEFPGDYSSSSYDADTAWLYGRSASDVSIDGNLASKLDSQRPLDELAQLLDQGYIDHLVEQQNRSGSSGADGSRASLNPDLYYSDPSRWGSGHGVNLQGDPAYNPVGEVSWKNIKSRSGRNAFARAESNASRVYRSLPKRSAHQSRAALLDYIGAVSKIPASDERAVEAEQAINYLSELDIKVTKALVQERAPRELLVEWSEVSVSTILGRQRSDIVKENIVPPFNPRPTIVHVLFRSQGNSRGEFDASRPVQIVFKLRVLGTDIQKAELLEDGELAQQLKMQDVDQGRVWEIENNPLQIPGVYTLLLVDNYGNEFRKNYEFKRLPARGGWKYDSARNVYNMEPSRGIDPRLDQAFALSSTPIRSGSDAVNRPARGRSAFTF